MTVGLDTNTLFSGIGYTAQNARGLVRNIRSDGMSLTPEKTEDEKRLESSTISFQRQLSPEEEQRVEFLKNLLAQTLTLAEGQPSDEQKGRIKEIEKELEKITGVKMRSSISNATDKMVGKKDEKKDEKVEQERQMRGIDPKEAMHANMPEKSQSVNPGMQMLQRNSLTTLLKNIDLSSLDRAETLTT